MQILSHRGKMKIEECGNDLDAFRICAQSGFGIETDIRSHQGELVVSHDPVLGEKHLSLRALLKDLKFPFLCLNIKEDGLAEALAELMGEHPEQNYCVFDMSVPDTLAYKRLGLPYLVRFSVYESINKELAENCSGIWVDCFEGIYLKNEELKSLLKFKVPMFFVSSELHGANHAEFWQFLKSHYTILSGSYLCTDLPGEAKEYFCP